MCADTVPGIQRDPDAPALPALPAVVMAASAVNGQSLDWMEDDTEYQSGEERLARQYPVLPEPAYLEFLRRKVERAQGSMRAGPGHPHAQVEADFAARHARMMAGQG